MRPSNTGSCRLHEMLCVWPELHGLAVLRFDCPLLCNLQVKQSFPCFPASYSPCPYPLRSAFSPALPTLPPFPLSPSPLT